MFTYLTPSNLIKAIILVMLGLAAAQGCSVIIRKLIGKHLQSRQLMLLRRVIFYGIASAFILAALQQIGFKLSVLVGTAGILTIAIGFASQTTATNFISGLFLMADPSFQLGDVITVNNITGKIMSIDALSIKLATADNQYVRIPNENLIKTSIINLTHFSQRRCDIAIHVSFQADLNQVRHVLLEEVQRNDHVLSEPEPIIQLKEWGHDAIAFQLLLWVNASDFGLVKDQMQQQIKERFQQENITIPYPCQTLYTDPNWPLKIESNGQER